MTSRGTENQLADEDEGKETNLKEKSSGKRLFHPEKQFTIEREEKMPS